MSESTRRLPYFLHKLHESGCRSLSSSAFDGPPCDCVRRLDDQDNASTGTTYSADVHPPESESREEAE